MKKKILLIVLAVVVVFIAVLGITYGPMLKRFLAYSVEEPDANMRILLGYGGNSVVLRSEDGNQVLIVDTKMAGGAGRVAKVVTAMAPEAEVTIVNTHFHGDHAGGNGRFPGARIIAGAYDTDEWMRETKMKRPPDVLLSAGQEHVLEIGDETVRIRNVGRGHSWNDVVVYFQNRKLLATGDLFFHTWHPVLIEAGGGNVASWIGDLDFLLETFEIETVVPGHGPVADRSGLEAQRAYFVSIREAAGDKARLAELKKKYKDWHPMPGMSGFDKTAAFAAKSEE